MFTQCMRNRTQDGASRKQCDTFWWMSVLKKENTHTCCPSTLQLNTRRFCVWSDYLWVAKHFSRVILGQTHHWVFFVIAHITSTVWICVLWSFLFSAWEIYSLTTMPRHCDANFRVGKAAIIATITRVGSSAGHRVWWVPEFKIRFHNFLKRSCCCRYIFVFLTQTKELFLPFPL